MLWRLYPWRGRGKKITPESANGVSWRQPVGCLRQAGQVPNRSRTRRRASPAVTIGILRWFTVHVCSSHVCTRYLRNYRARRIIHRNVPTRSPPEFISPPRRNLRGLQDISSCGTGGKKARPSLTQARNVFIPPAKNLLFSFATCAAHVT